MVTRTTIRLVFRDTRNEYNEEKHGKKQASELLCLGDGGGGGALHTWNNNTPTINYLDVSAADEGLVEDGVGEGLR